jgi:hypothetical protein
MKAVELEMLVWRKVRDAINNPEVMKEHIGKAIAELEEKKTQTGSEILDIEIPVKKRSEGAPIISSVRGLM